MDRRLIVWLAVGAVLVIAAFALLSQPSAVKKAVTNEELVQLQASGATVVDVRTNAEFISGHIANSLSIPLDQLAAAVSGWDKSRPVVVYCATGARSAEAATYLADQGFKQVYDLTAGMVGWKGEVQGGQATASAPVAAGAVKTDGKPVFIDFSGSS